MSLTVTFVISVCWRLLADLPKWRDELDIKKSALQWHSLTMKETLLILNIRQTFLISLRIFIP